MVVSALQYYNDIGTCTCTMYMYMYVNVHQFSLWWQDYTNERLHAVRIRTLPPGTVKFEVCTYSA